MKLIKLSLPSWTKEFATEAELKANLYSHICEHCRKGEVWEPEGMDPWTIWDPVDANSSLGDMLNTGCGCEYDVKDDNEEV